MKADYEPWWKFEGWESNIVSIYEYQTKAQLEAGLNAILEKFRAKYEHEANRDDIYYAFWTDEECEFCEACDDDLQIYHGMIIEK